jgi:hypothetical protein
MLTISHHNLGMHALEYHQSFNKTKDFAWTHDRFEDSMVAAGLSGIETGTKLYISNLHYGVTKEDLQVTGSLYYV